MKKILIVVGTRPNFIKVTQFKKVAKKLSNFEIRIVHTGQHHEQQLANVFFEQFDLKPDHFLSIDLSTPVKQMADIMVGLENIIKEYKPDLVMVPGDVNSTLAAAIATNKNNVKLAHIESGLRSFDRGMPEEFNRITTDIFSDHLFVTEQSGIDNLKKDGREDAICFVGNTMIDTLVAFDDKIQGSGIVSELGVEKGKFILMTMHRPSNVDSKEGLEKLFVLIEKLTKKNKLVFPVHPRTIKNMKLHGLDAKFNSLKGLIITEPMDYFSFQKLICETLCVITDSGGVQEETTFRKVPCLTLRNNTERPITIDIGTNELVAFDPILIEKKIEEILSGKGKKGTIPPLWDGKATERILAYLQKVL